MSFYCWNDWHFNSTDTPILCVGLPDGCHGQRWPCRWCGARAHPLLQAPSSPAVSYELPRGWWHSWEGGEGLQVGKRRVTWRKERKNERHVKKSYKNIPVSFYLFRCPHCVVSLLVIWYTILLVVLLKTKELELNLNLSTLITALYKASLDGLWQQTSTE